MKKKSFAFFFLFFVLAQQMMAKSCYLLTCAPGEKVYEIYGHSALLVVDDENIGRVYNYGIFSFSEENFMLKFVLGQTNYLLDDDDFYAFLSDRKTDVSLLKLDLTDIEQNRLDSLLQENMRIENRRYLYNYFNDNCATRIRDLIEKSAHVSYNEIPAATYRTCVRDCVGDNWQMFGINLLLGAPADTLISVREQMFLPLVMEEAFASATVMRDSMTAPLASTPAALIPGRQANHEAQKSLFSPTLFFALLLMAVAWCTLHEWRKKRWNRAVDALLLLSCGLAGVIVCFVSFFSIHPTVYPNYVALLLHPLQLVALALLFFSPKSYVYYACLNLLSLAVMIAIGLCGVQHFDAGVYLLAAAFFMRAPLIARRKVNL